MGRAEKRRAEKAKRAREDAPSGAGASRQRRSASSPGGWPVAPVALALALLLVLAWVVPLSDAGNRYPDDVLLYWAGGAVVVAGVAILSVTIRSRFLESLPERCGALLMRPSPRVFVAITATTALALATIFAFYAFRLRATTSDEIAQLWQARILLTGRLSLPPDPNREFFSLENVIDSGRWFSQFPIGGPLVILPGALIGAPWLVNPLLLGMSVVALYWFARNVYGEMQGRAITALFAVTAMVLYLAGTWMNHVSVLFLVTVTLAALFEWERSTTPARAIMFAAVIGLALGFIATIRPLDAIIVAIPIGLFQLWAIRRTRSRIRDIAVQAVAGVVGTLPVLIANAKTTGSAFRFGYEAMWGAGHQIGFRVDPYGNVHTVGRALSLGMRYLGELNMSLTAWPTPVLLILIGGLLMFRRLTRWDNLLIALFVAQVVAYSSYSLVGELLGPRFLYTALATPVVFLARAPFVAGERGGATWRRVVLVTILACVVVSWTTPWVHYSVWGLATDTRNTRRTMKLDITGAVRRANVKHAVVFFHEPLGTRLLRRLWGLGMGRSESARLLDAADVCSLIAAIRSAEVAAVPPSGKVNMVLQSAAAFVQGPRSAQAGSPRVRVSDREALTPLCRAEIDRDNRFSSVPFGQALPLEPIGPNGEIAGDVIYAADLGDHNEVLRARFGDRTWYRVATKPGTNGEVEAVIAPY